MNARTDLPDYPIAHLRVPPHSIEAESSVLGALLLDNSAWDRCGDLVTADDFYRHEHKEIFQTIAALCNASKTADMITVFERLQAAGKDDQVGGMAYLHSLSQYVPSASNLRRYAEIVRERALSRRLVSVADEIGVMGFKQDEPIADRIDKATAQILKLVPESTTADWVPVDETITALLDHISARAEGNQDFLPTGLKDLDDMLDGGMRAGQLIIIGARPAMGKSALAVSVGMNVALHQGHPVGMFSLEMPKEELATRQLSMVSHIHLSKLKRSERLSDYDWTRVTEGVEKLRKTNFHISEHSGININQLRARARKLKRQSGLSLLIVDYLGLMGQTNPKDNRNNALGEATRGMKNLAKELGIPIICLAQLGRDVEKRTGARPVLSDLRDSGEIEQDADIVIFIDRPVHRDPTLKDSEEWKRYATAIVAKQRNGPTGDVHLRYVGENVQFLDWEGDKPSRAGRSGGGL